MNFAALVALTLLGSAAGHEGRHSEWGTQLRNVTLASPKVYDRLGEKYFKAGMAFQIAAVICMLVLVVAQVYKKMNARNTPSLGFWEAVTQTPELLAFIFTCLAYVVLDGLYEPTFVGSSLHIFTVNSTCTGMNCSAPFSVLAGGVKEALAESCHQFSVHHKECSEKTHWQEVSGWDFCKNDPGNVAEVYFKGASHHALGFAFVAGCFLAFLLNISDVIRYWQKDYVLDTLLSAVKVKELEKADKGLGLGVVGAMTNVDSMNAKKKKKHKEDKESTKLMRVQIFMRMAWEGLSYGLMMMILEVEIEGDCVAMRAMLPINIAAMWAYTIISVTSLVVISFCIIFFLNLFKNVGALKRVLTRFSVVFIALMGIFVFFAFMAYVYSVVLALYLAYTVPSDSAVIVGCGLTMLSMGSQAAAMYDPQPPDHWDDDEEEGEEEEEEETDEEAQE